MHGNEYAKPDDNAGHQKSFSENKDRRFGSLTVYILFLKKIICESLKAYHTIYIMHINSVDLKNIMYPDNTWDSDDALY